MDKDEVKNFRNDLLRFAEKVENELSEEHLIELMEIIEKVNHYVY